LFEICKLIVKLADLVKHKNIRSRKKKHRGGRERERERESRK